MSGLEGHKRGLTVQLVEYAVAAKISVEPAFAWLLPHTLKKRSRKIERVESKYCLKTYKFRIKVPENTNQSIEFYPENWNTLWCDTMCQDIKNVRPAFEPWEKTEGDIHPGNQ